ncbi:sugar phosphate isomerase/epimerase family protein [Fundicoccus culcitae]|uniref:Sugar phosphate isomerase/epimerase n=1 Tax=Fundicoccus culcitae TaxID=2969821 RepID=A0ABY5P5Q4_9LACT|nr:sugar phosphate isomerase/epimerase [Fundicoccus culcitae]UUX33901.1 sugar phosphate isomerase/epimerase [Fundicoccus culcitae]
MSIPKIALQLWSIKEHIQDNLENSLKEVSQMGYDGVEFAGYFGHKAEDVKSWLDEYHLQVAASHTPFESLQNDLEAEIEYAKTVGNKFIIVPYATFDNLAGWENFWKEMEAIARRLNDEDIMLGYHNHNHEFDGSKGYDILDLAAKLAPSILLEIDTYWVNFAGVDSVKWIKKHTDSVGMLHIKDFDATNQESIQIGEGTLPIADYVKVASRLEHPWLVIEQEAFRTATPLEAAAANVKALREIVKEVAK